MLYNVHKGIHNEVLAWCRSKRKQALVLKVDFTKAYDSVRWDFLLDVLYAFGFGSRWCKWIRGIFSSKMASILVNGSPTNEFSICYGLKQGDPLAPFLFILIMESLHFSVSRAVSDGVFKGLHLQDSVSLSHLFYADDAVFIGEWFEGNLDNLIKILKCFYLASGLRINVNKSQILGVGVPSDSVRQGALRIGCEVLQLPFKYLGVMVGDQMSRNSVWANTILKVCARLSKWKVNTLSVGAPVRVLHEMEMLRNKFFNGGSFQDRKITWVAWNNVLSSKKKGGLGVSSFYALNRTLLLKWVWCFLSQYGSLWSQVISAIHGSRLESHSHKSYSTWVRNGSNTRFWLDSWILNTPLSVRFPRIFALETIKDISVASKWNASSFDASFRRLVRDEAENHQWLEMILMLDTVILSSSGDRWLCDINGDGVFRVKDIRSILDDLILPSSDIPTRWVKYLPIKINVFAWRARLDRLPTRVLHFKSTTATTTSNHRRHYQVSPPPSTASTTNLTNHRRKYRLALPPQLSHVHDVFHVSLLRGYHYHPLHVASYPFDQIQPDMSLSEEPESILDRQERVMRNKVIPFVKILWKNHPEREATWETEESMRASYPHFFV
ncbi:RNA-directed DNA polymerase, eukaryota [Tanacetum coccineum]